MSIAALLTLLKSKTMDLSYYDKSVEDGKEQHSSRIFMKIHLTLEKYHLSRCRYTQRYHNVLLSLLSTSDRIATSL